MTRVQILMSGLIITCCLIFIVFYFSPRPKATITLPDQTVVSALIADTPALHEKGLSDRAKPVSMLFLHKEKTLPVYWMKDMRFPIDLIWLDGETVVGLLSDLSPENPPTTLYSPDVPVDRVLEVPAGFIKLHTLSIGDVLDMTLPKR